jgi:hypothetical protein
MATQFRQLGPDDAEALADRMQVWHELEGVRLDASMTRREAQRLLQDNLGWHTWMIESQDKAVGYLMLQFRKGVTREAPRAYVAALYLVPPCRQLGTGMLAHRFVTELSRWLQVRVYEFDTARENKHAHLFSRCASRTDPWTSSSSMQATA